MTEKTTTGFLGNTEFHPFRLAIVIAAVIIASLLARNAPGQQAKTVNWSTSFRDATEQAQRYNAPIMLFFTGSDWCPWCEKLNVEVFETAEFAKWSDSKLIPVILDFPKQKKLPSVLTRQNNRLLEQYRPHLTGFPTALFVKADGTVIGKLGYEKGGVIKWTHKAQKIVGQLDKIALESTWPFQHQNVLVKR